jgi:hypothetical protein
MVGISTPVFLCIVDRRWSSILSRSAEDQEFPKVSRHIHIIPGVDKGCGICKWLQPRSLLASMLLLLKSPFLSYTIYIYNNEDSSNTVVIVPDSEIIMVIHKFSFEFLNQGNVMKFI